MGSEFGSTLVALATIGVIVLLVCWIVLPFAVLGVKPLLRQIVAQQKEIAALLRQGRAGGERRGPPPG